MGDKPCCESTWRTQVESPCAGPLATVEDGTGTAAMERASSGERSAESRSFVQPGTVRVVVSIANRGVIERVVTLQESEVKRVEVVVPE